MCGMCVEAPMESGVAISGHQCQPSRLAGRPRAHGTPSGTVVDCPCGKRWQVTRNHYDNHGRRGAICGCGWKLLDQAKEAAA